MAIGFGMMFGFRYLRNFNYPYIAKSATEFWRRWHISLGSLFRDYVYIPLGGNRRGKSRWLINLMIVWGLTGVWHGAVWNFVLWCFVLLSAPYRREAVASQANGKASRRAAAPLRDRRVHVRLTHLLDRGSCGARRILARLGRGFRRHGNLDLLGAQRVGVLAGAPDMRRRQHPRPSLAACEGRRMGERSQRARVSGGRSARGEAPFRGRALRHSGMVRRLAFRRAQIRKARRADARDRCRCRSACIARSFDSQRGSGDVQSVHILQVLGRRGSCIRNEMSAVVTPQNPMKRRLGVRLGRLSYRALFLWHASRFS